MDLQKVLQSTVDNFGFEFATLFLWNSHRQPIQLKAVRHRLMPTALNTYIKEHVNIKEVSPEELLTHLNAVAVTTLPVVMRAGDDIGTMEIGLLGLPGNMAEHLLNKAISIGRHVADIIQESFFKREKDRNLRQLSVWLETVSTISSSMDIKQVLHVVAQLTADLFAARCCIFLLEEHGNYLIPAVAVGSFDPVLKKKWKALKNHPPFAAILNILQTRQPLVLTPQNIESYMPADIVNDFSYTWLVMAPIMARGRVLGVMQVDRPAQGSNFEREEVAIISAMARETAIAMENAMLMEKLAQKETLLHQLFNRLIGAQEEERKRVASEIHDGVIQALLGIWYRLQHLSAGHVEEQDFNHELAKLTEHLGEQIRNIRCIVYNLRPVMLDTYGLGPAVRSLLRNVQEENKINFELALEGSNQRLPLNFELTLYRILQELLANVLKHSQATKVQVMLISGQEQTVMAVKDNGTGFNQARLLNCENPANHLGLASIQERVLALRGSCNIDSRLGWGTTVTIKLPTPNAV